MVKIYIGWQTDLSTHTTDNFISCRTLEFSRRKVDGCNELGGFFVMIPPQLHHPSDTSRIIITVKPAIVAMVTISMFASFR